MRILITGSTVHARQYIESFMFDRGISLLFLPDRTNRISETIESYGIRTTSRTEIAEHLNSFDAVVVANLAGEKLSVLRFLSESGYAGNCIIEKPFAIDEASFQKKTELLNDNRYVVAYSRQLYKQEILEKVKEARNMHNSLLWPNFNELGIDMVRDTLPHVLDFLFIANEGKIFNLIIEDISSSALHFTAFFSGTSYHVTVYNTVSDNDFVKLNNTIFDWPNYFIYNPKMLHRLMTDNGFVEENNRANRTINKLYSKSVHDIASLIPPSRP